MRSGFNSRRPERSKTGSFLPVFRSLINSGFIWYDIVAKKQITFDIKNFYVKNGRIPLKREYRYYNAARLRFGTWNKAIEAAGLNPNPVLFSKKYLANDEHVCDSLAEKIIDDWFSARKIPHERNVSYPNCKYTCDFKIGDTLVEFFGLSGELRSYDNYKKRKIQIARKNHIKLVSIYPQDLFPESRLDFILGNFIHLAKTRI